MWGPQYHPGVICSETSQDPAVRSRLWFVTVKGHKAKPVMGKGVWDEVWREAGTAPRVFSLLPWDRTNGSSPELWQHMWNEVFQGSSWRLDAEDLTVCLVRAKTSDSGRKAGVQHQLYCLHKLFSHSEPFLSGNDGSPPKPQVPWCQPRATRQIDVS